MAIDRINRRGSEEENPQESTQAEERGGRRTNIYDRQERISGWNQSKIDNATVAVVGTGLFANDALATLAGLGIGELYIFGNERVNGRDPAEYLLFRAKKGASKAEELEKIVSEINPNIKVKGIHWDMSMEEFVENIMPKKLDIIVDAANHPAVELNLFNYGMEHGITVINGSCTDHMGSVSVTNPSAIKLRPRVNGTFKKTDVDVTYLFADYLGKPEESGASSVISGLMADEVRKRLLPLKKNEKNIEAPVHLNLNSTQRTVEQALVTDADRVVHSDYEAPKKVLVVGAGSLGWDVGLKLALKFRNKDTTVYVVDGDEVEEANLNRQIIYWDCVGEKKALALERKVNMMTGKKSIKGIDAWFDENFRLPDGSVPDLMLDCTDRFKVREVINNYAIANNVPLISGATSFSGARVVTYKPGETKCLECLLNISKKAEEERQAESCTRAPEASVIITNRICAGSMIGEVDMLYAGKPLEGILVYDSFAPTRIGVMPSSGPCDCHTKYQDQAQDKGQEKKKK